jgi:hypothetical protein
VIRTKRDREKIEIGRNESVVPPSMKEWTLDQIRRPHHVNAVKKEPVRLEGW